MISSTFKRLGIANFDQYSGLVTCFYAEKLPRSILPVGYQSCYRTCTSEKSTGGEPSKIGLSASARRVVLSNPDVIKIPKIILYY